MSGWNEDELRQELARILASEPFRSAEAARRFLTFVVEETLAGRAGQIKEAVIGREVFLRGDDFDPRIDPVARIQAGKVRTKLREYYEGLTAQASLVIELPKGTYVPEFRYPPVAPPPAAVEAGSTSLEVGPVRRRLHWIWMLAACGAVAVCGFASVSLVRRWHHQAGSSRVYQLSIPFPEGFTHVAWPVVSPDGRWIAFTGVRGDEARRLWLVDLTTQALQAVTGTESAGYPFWSTDSQTIGFADPDKGLILKVSVAGGVVHRVAEGLKLRFRGGSWNEAGDLLYAQSEGPVYLLQAGGANARAVTVLDSSLDEISHRDPIFLPDGRHFLYLAAQPGNATGTLYVGDTQSPLRKKVTPSNSNASFANGHLYFQQGGALLRVPFDADSFELTGDAVTVASNVEGDTDLFIGSFSLSRSAEVLVWSPDRAQAQLVWVDRTGKTLEVIHQGWRYDQVSMARNVPKLAAAIHDPAKLKRDIYSFDLARHTIMRETHGPRASGMPVMSPDGSRMIVSGNRKDGLDLFVRELGSTGEERPLLPKPEPYRYATDWSRDGKNILFTQRNTQTGEDVWITPVDNGKAARALVATPYKEAQAQFSPDGRWVAYTSDDGGAAQVYVMPVDGGPRRQVSVAGGMEPRWRADGRELFFITPGGMMAVVAVSTSPVWKAGAPVELFRCSPTRTFGWTAATGYDVSNDGSRFVLSQKRLLSIGFNVRLER